jgi:hypothetical protein
MVTTPMFRFRKKKKSQKKTFAMRNKKNRVYDRIGYARRWMKAIGVQARTTQQ